MFTCTLRRALYMSGAQVQGTIKSGPYIISMRHVLGACKCFPKKAAG